MNFLSNLFGTAVYTGGKDLPFTKRVEGAFPVRQDLSIEEQRKILTQPTPTATQAPIPTSTPTAEPTPRPIQDTSLAQNAAIFYEMAKKAEQEKQIAGLAKRLLGIYGQESTFGLDDRALKAISGDVGPLQINDQYVQGNPTQTAFNMKIEGEDRRNLEKALQFAVELVSNYYNQGQQQMGLNPEQALDRATWKYNGDPNYLNLVKGRIEQAGY